MAGNKAGKIIAILIIIILILLGFIAYMFLIKPAFNSYVIKKQIEAKDIVLGTLLLQIQQRGYAQITDNQGNIIILVPLQQQPGQNLTQ